MNKKILLLSTVALGAIAAITAALWPTEATYQERLETSHEPYTMRWAQLDATTGEFNPYARNQVSERIANRVSRAGDLGISFTSKGPDNVGGRTRAIIELHGDPETLLAGGTTGGLFVSYNGGATWESHQQFQNQLETSSIIASIHQDTITGTIYIGTGSNFDAYASSTGINWPGYGIFVSTDDGATFSHMESTTPDERFSTAGDPWLAVNRIKTNADGDIYAATARGLMLSTDGGETWINPVYVDPPTYNIQTNAICADVSVSKSGKVLVGFYGGSVFLSEDGSDKSFENLNGTGYVSGGKRVITDIAESDEDIMYVLTTDGDACMRNLFKTTNGGAGWTSILEPFADFNPLQQGSGLGCQGVYDLAMACSPTDPETVFIGGIQLWRFDGSLTRVANEFGQPPFQDVFENYVHADKHFFYFSPNNKKRMYVTSDGGISVTTNRGNTWQGLNKGYYTTQFYGIAHGTDGGIIIGGTQDNGTLLVAGDNYNSNDPNIGFEVFGNDGIDCDMSQLMPVAFATSQEGLVVRVDLSAAENSNGSFPSAFISAMRSNNIFQTVVKVWENSNEATSQDSILFEVEGSEIAIATGNGILRTFNETVAPVQPAAKVVESSVSVSSGTLDLTLDTDGTTLIGDGEGTVTFNDDGSMDISVTFDEAPAENANILVVFEERYEANSVIYIDSKNLQSLQGAYTFEHRLETDLNPGDVIKIQDPVQSYLLSTGDNQGAAAVGGGIRFYRNVLNAQELPPGPIGIPTSMGNVTCAETSADGDVAYIGNSSGSVYRISGLLDLYTEDDLDKVTVSNIGSGISGAVTGIAVDPNDDERIVVTTGSYNSSANVYVSNNAKTGSASFSSIHGDLLPMPVYDAEFNVNSPNMVILGTEFGLWATEDITASSVVWSDENEELTYVPVYDVRQQELPYARANNTGVVYVGTHGRGFWESQSLVGMDEVNPFASDDTPINALNVYPNPLKGQGKIEFESNSVGLADIRIFDINGRQVKSWNHLTRSGVNTINFNALEMKSGSYFVTIEAGGSKNVAKFMVVK